MKIQIKLFLFVFSFIIAMGGIAYPTGIPVFDISTFSQALISAQNSFESLTQQATQIKNQMTMIQNQVRTRAMLPHETFNVIVNALMNQTGKLNDLINNAEGMGFKIDNIKVEYGNLFPDSDSWKNQSVSTRREYLNKWNNELNNASITAIKNQNILSKLSSNNEAIQEILSSTKEADGEVRQLQSINQQLAYMSIHLNDITQLLATTGRIITTAASTEESREAQERAMIDEATSIEKFQTPESEMHKTFKPGLD